MNDKVFFISGSVGVSSGPERHVAVFDCDVVVSGSITSTSPSSTLPSGFFGDGSDGVGVADGFATLAGASLSGTTYTLSRDVYFTSLSVSSGISIDTNGYRLFANGILDNNGSISRNGLNSTSATPAAALIAGSLGGSSQGGRGGSPSSAGVFIVNSLGGAGAGGGGGSAGGTVSQPNSSFGLLHALPSLSFGSVTNGSSWVQLNGGSGGGGGGGNTNGGGGGSGAGYLFVAAFKLTGTGDLVANGGNGAPASDAISGGGGGGGGGANILIFNDKSTWTGVQSASGGFGGVGGGIYGNGFDGSNGTVIAFFSN